MYQNNDNMSEAFFQDFNIQWTHFKQYSPPLSFWAIIYLSYTPICPVFVPLSPKYAECIVIHQSY